MGAVEPGPAAATPDENSHGKAIEDSEAEWEYEHDEHETEDLYFTLDLTAHQPPAPPKPGQKRKYNTKKAGRKKSGGARDEASGANGNGEAATPSRVDKADAQQDSPAALTPDEARDLQVLGLHTTNPIVKLGSSIYSCDWCTDLGTQVYVSRAGAVEDPVRRGNVVDTIALSRVRLIGTPATLRRKSEALVPTNGVQPADSSTVEDGHPAIAGETSDGATAQAGPISTANTGPGAPFANARASMKDPAAKAQASFLERLAIIKHNKGETDRIPLTGVKQYNLPAADEEDEVDDAAGEAARPPARKRRVEADQGMYRATTDEVESQRPGKRSRNEYESPEFAPAGEVLSSTNGEPNNQDALPSSIGERSAIPEPGASLSQLLQSYVNAEAAEQQPPAQAQPEQADNEDASPG